MLRNFFELKQNYLVFFFFSFFSIIVLSPLSSNQILPAVADFVFHTSGIQQAKFAILSGEFPIRVLFYQQDGLFQLPYFNFYSPVVYFLGGFFELFINNPYIVFKLCLFIALTCAACYFYKIISFSIKSEKIAFLCALVYISTPYILINIHIRAAYTEAIAQCLIPFILYNVLRLYDDSQFNLGYFVYLTIGCFLLIGTHLITFVYTSLFIGFLVLSLTVQNPSKWKNLAICLLSLIIAVLLAFWYLMPIALYSKFLVITRFVQQTFYSHTLTPLSTLLSPTAVSPEPILGSTLNPHNNNVPIALYPAVGWPLLSGFCIIIYYLFSSKGDFKNIVRNNKMVKTLIVIFLLALFIVWSPLDFWRFMPNIITFVQYTYRVLSQVSWIGTFLLGYALLIIFSEKK